MKGRPSALSPDGLTRLYLAVPVLALAALGGCSPSLATAPAPVTPTVSYCSTFDPPRCHETREIDKTSGVKYAAVVVLPKDYTPTRQYKYLLITDPHRNLLLAEAALRSLDGVIEPLVLVGVGTPKGFSEASTITRRIHDFTDQQFPLRGELLEALTEFCGRDERSPTPCFGGAANFHRWITTDLLPQLMKRYSLAVDGNALIGTSAGGYFTVLAALHYPSGFSHYIATSPALGYGAALLEQTPREAANGRKLFVALGDLEARSPFLTGPADVTDGFVRLQRFVARHPSSSPQSTFEIMEGYGHGDVVIPALIRALRGYYEENPEPEAAQR